MDVWLIYICKYCLTFWYILSKVKNFSSEIQSCEVKVKCLCHFKLESIKFTSKDYVYISEFRFFQILGVILFKFFNIWIFQRLSSGIYNYQHDRLRHGICVPLSCPLAMVNGTDVSLLQDIQICYDEKFSYTGLRGTVSELICETNQQKYPLDNADIIMA